MTPGLRTFKSASLRVAVAESLPEEMQSDVRELVAVQSGNPMKGHATSLLRAVCQEADADWKTLFLEVKPFDDGPGMEKLEKWYGRFKFVRIQDQPLLMARSPRNYWQRAVEFIYRAP